MKVTINPDGSVTLDVATAAEALDIQVEVAKRKQPDVKADLAEAIAAGLSPLPGLETPAEARMNLAAKRAKPHMNDLQFATWEVLQAYDCESGVHARFVAEFLGISEPAAGQRLQRLVMTGDAKRVVRGKYRPLP